MSDLVQRLQKMRGPYLGDGVNPGVTTTEILAELDRLRSALRYQDDRDGRISTHGPTCYSFGHRHYECALVEIERLTRELEAAKKDAGRLDWMSEHEARIGWNREGDLCRVWIQNYDDGAWLPVCGWDKLFDTPRQAIDDAMSQEKRAGALDRMTRNAEELGLDY